MTAYIVVVTIPEIKTFKGNLEDDEPIIFFNRKEAVQYIKDSVNTENGIGPDEGVEFYIVPIDIHTGRKEKIWPKG